MTEVAKEDLIRLYDALNHTNEKLGAVAEALAGARTRLDAIERDVEEAREEIKDTKRRFDGLGWRIIATASPGLAALIWRLMEK